ncbi:hypothetical protein BJ970_003429 [Saccharopolyspora phatthalungensis]|uniref:Uncharacterized protein n=1 Tax=Saccharopolyspora phatthalungensis TaxID=664693 RepID=A0A840QBS8_9PSEU|nr:hypothetical protein [Saccharopolyspora phatthalungensis]
MTSFLIAIAMCYILFKIPFWILGSMRGGGRSFIGSVVRGFIAYKTLGLVGGAGAAIRGRQGSRGSSTSSSSMPDPYENVRSTSGGQYVLPLGGWCRTGF